MKKFIQGRADKEYSTLLWLSKVIKVEPLLLKKITLDEYL